MLGENVIDNHRIGGDHVSDRTIIHQQVFEEPHRLLGQRVAHGRGELGELLQVPAVVRDEVPHAQPAGAELLGHAPHPGVLQHASQLFLHDRRLMEPCCLRPQLVVGDRVPQQEAQPRRQFVARDRLPVRPGRRLLNPVQKPRRREDAGERGAERGIMLRPFGAVGAVRRKDRLAFVGGKWPAPGAVGKGEQRLKVP